MNKHQKTAADNCGGGTLGDVLLKEKGIIRNVVGFSSVFQTSRLLTTCTELYTAKDVILYQLPVVCDMSGDDLDSDMELDNDGQDQKVVMLRKMYTLMVQPANSHWLLSWLDTSRVKELKLPGTLSQREETLRQDKDLLVLTGGKRFAQLQKLDFGVSLKKGNFEDLSEWKSYSDQVSPATGGNSLGEVGRRCPNLQSLNLSSCSSITDAGLSEVASGCSNLQSLDIWNCSSITDAGLSEVAKGCSNLQSLNVSNCGSITDAGLSEVAKGCSNLLSLDISNCSSITDAGLSEVAACSKLQSLDLRGCTNITDTGLSEVAKGCPNLLSLDLYGCTNITGAGLSEVARLCLNLRSLDCRDCKAITAASKAALRHSHPKLDFSCDRDWVDYDSENPNDY